MSKTLVLVMIIVIAGAAGIYSALTYPRAVLDFPVSFTVGADVTRRAFNVPILNGRAQVEVVVNSGTSLWTAEISNQGNTLWSHGALQGGQTTYKSEWIELPSGSYNFTFATTGGGPLNAGIKVISKGGFW